MTADTHVSSRQACSAISHRIRAVCLAFTLILAFLAGWAGQAAAQPSVTGVRIGGDAAATRFVMEMTEAAKPEVFTLAAPYRVVVDFPELAWRLAPKDVSAHGGLIDGFRFGLFEAGRSRLVIDLRAAAAVKSAFTIEPRDGHRYRFVLDLERVADSAFQDQDPNRPQPQPVPTAAAPQTAAVMRPPAPVPPPPPRKPGDTRHIIVVDAGHGGVDPGAIGPGGTYEKNITLAVAREVKSHLEATGRYKVVLSRNKDIFIRLRDRIAIAREAGAELFISLHADSISNRRTRGGSVYTLSEVASDKEAELLAAKENKADLIAGIDLSHESPEVASILLDLAQRETMNYSARLAAMLVTELDKSVRMLSNSHRFAGFAVLKAPDVPSVLIEMGYLSNPAEEKEMKKASYRRKVADSLLRSVDRYFRERDAR